MREVQLKAYKCLIAATVRLEVPLTVPLPSQHLVQRAMLPQSTEEKFKAAALRDACDKNNCDVLGYAMYDVDSTNFFLFKTYDVSVKGFPGNVESLENVNRSYSPSNSYWRRHSLTDGAYSPNSMPYSDSKWRQSLRSTSGK